MMKRGTREYNPSAIEQASQRDWNERWGDRVKQRDRMFVVAVCALGLAAAATGRSWYYDSQPKREPWIIDRNGPSVMVAHLEMHLPDAARIKGHLTDWIRGLRSVSSDPIQQKRMVDQTYAWVDSATIAHQQLDSWYVINNPYKRVKEYTTDVDVTSVVSQGGSGWLIDWTETAWAREPGKNPQISCWRMSVNVHVRLPETDAEFRANWDGVFVDSMHLISLGCKV